MSKPYEDKTVTITLPAAPTGTVTLSTYHEYGDLVDEDRAATLDTGTTYEATIPWSALDSAGSYRVDWTATIGGEEYLISKSFVLADQYILFTEFESRNNFISISETEFNKLERTAREIIDTFCGQSFQRVVNKTRTYYGSGKETLHLDERITKINEILIDTEDYTAYMEIDKRSHRFLRFLTSLETSYKIGSRAEVDVLGDWGWLYVPQNVEDAADLLVQDLSTDDRASYRYNVKQQDHDTVRTKYGNSMYETVGNIDADVLLMDYVLFEIGYISE